jgi:Bacterial protein of unknown function (DUF885)
LLPARALSYKIEQLTIEELRNKYKKQLGKKFSLKYFHDVLLKGGSLPLNVFEIYMDEWAGTQKEAALKAINRIIAVKAVRRKVLIFNLRFLIAFPASRQNMTFVTPLFIPAILANSQIQADGSFTLKENPIMIFTNKVLI